MIQKIGNYLSLVLLGTVVGLTAACTYTIRPPTPEAPLSATHEKFSVPEAFASLAAVQAATSLPLLAPSTTVSPTLTFVRGTYQSGDQGHEAIQLAYQTSTTTGNFVLFVDMTSTPTSLAQAPILQQLTMEIVNVRNHIGFLVTVPSHLQVYYLIWQEAGLQFSLWGSFDAATIRRIAEQLEPVATLNGENAALPEQTTPATAAPTTDAPIIVAVQGAAGLGDPLFPLAGNGGYDVQHYDLDLTVDVKSNTITSTATLTILATATLDTFNLDFHALTIDALTVNGVETPYQRQDDELVIDPLTPLAENASFTVTVHYHGRPTPLLFDGYNGGWLNFFDSVGVGNEPIGAATWYPVNDHPLDRATYRFAVTVPAPYVVAASGQLQETSTNADGWITYRWVMDEPMASYLTAIAIDQFTIEQETLADGTVLRNYIAPNISARSLTLIEPTAAMLAMLIEAVGPYPYAEYGVVLHNHAPYALETQTLSQLSQQALRDWGEEVVVHELAHQWFGNSIGLAQWQDVWLKEGFVTYAEWLWIEESQGAAAMRTRIENIYAHTPGLDSPLAAPTVETLYDNSVYYRGALTLYALRLQIGDERFSQLLHSYYTRYRGGYATTADFVALAEEISGADLTAFFQEWLYAETLPPLPSVE